MMGAQIFLAPDLRPSLLRTQHYNHYAIPFSVFVNKSLKNLTGVIPLPSRKTLCPYIPNVLLGFCDFVAFQHLLRSYLAQYEQ